MVVGWHLGRASLSKTLLCFCSRPVIPITVWFSQNGKPVAGTRQAGKTLSQGVVDFPFKATNHTWAT